MPRRWIQLNTDCLFKILLPFSRQSDHVRVSSKKRDEIMNMSLLTYRADSAELEPDIREVVRESSLNSVNAACESTREVARSETEA
ncbi:hypothetical protein [Halapricum salinum]|uniref:Uncharacterized protein n=1 Tax=Halapricum salinum TaxID=1457250 RepID=A0A4D6HEJ0_9EURY|nr:hypothetical protein [Halapricum salinum]QCC52409.1 hypothetical protein DV733_14720 [Halapricum salinum]